MTPSLTRITLEPPYLLFLGDVAHPAHAKTGFGIAHWRPERCRGQFRLPGCEVDLGLPDLSLDAAAAAGVRTAIIAVAPPGGRIGASWITPLAALARAGISLAAGLHSRLSEMPELVTAAAGGARLIDVRVPPAGLEVASGRKRSGQRVLTVGTDCALGKKYTALAMHQELLARGLPASFRASGQTGIMIAGEGIPIDAVVADFVAGAAEALSPDNDTAHWDVIEGQGALMHPAYAGVSLGLLHGSQPDAFVVCHDPGRRELLGWEGRFPLPAIETVIDRTVQLGQLTNPGIRCMGVSLNTSMLPDAERGPACARVSARTGLPCVDPVAQGVGPLIDALLR